MAILVTSLPNALNDRYIDEDERCNDESEPLVALRRPSRAQLHIKPLASLEA